MSSRRCIVILVVESFLTVAVFIPSAYFEFYGQPFERGFFCNDESLMHPYKKNTISTTMLALLAFFIPLCIIVSVELLISCHQSFGIKHSASPEACGFHCPGAVVNIFRYTMWTTFAAGATLMLTDFGKYCVGRQRPHFFAVCGFDPRGPNCTTGYIETYKCGSEMAKHLKQARLSFPSGHASISASTAVSCCLYIHFRLYTPGIRRFKPLLQALLIGLAVLCGCSRISDYMHHWSDVLAGLLLGGIVSAAIWIGCTDLPEQRHLQLETEETSDVGMRELGTTNSVVHIP